MNAMRLFVQELLADERGATALEYGLIAALIVLVLLAGLTSVAEVNDDTYEMIENAIVV